MAVHSPVVLDSSSPPPAFRHPSITPQKSAEANVSSSPGLPEVSAFFKDKAPASPGFTSAGSLWKAAALEAERKEQEGRSNASKVGSEAVDKKITGQFPRPVKKVQTAEKVAASVSRIRTPSISLSEFDFKADESPVNMQPPQATKKIGKRAVKPKDNGENIKVGKAGKGRDDENGQSKSSKRAGQLAVGASTSKQAVTGASGRRNKKLSALPALPSGESGSTRRHSISIPGFSYDAGEPTTAVEDQQTSAFFSLPAVNGSGLPNIPVAKVAEAAQDQDAAAFQTPLDPATSTKDTVRASAAPAKDVGTRSEHIAGRPSVSLSDLDPRPDVPSAGIKDGLSKPVTNRKPRKRTTDPKGISEGGKARRPKKRLAKSASIILNSDEPDLVADRPAADDRTPSVDDIQAVDCVSKTKKAPKPAKPVAVGGLTAPVEAGFGVWSQSAYFNQVAAAKPVEMDTTAESLQTVFSAIIDDPAAAQESNSTNCCVSPHPRTSFPRRRSWTPAKNTYETLDPEVDSSGESPAARKTLAELVGGFSYDEQGQAPARSHAGEPLIKRRRIEVTETSASIPAQRKANVVKEKVKKVKAPKKKPQTITDLATKAYRAEEEQVSNARSTVSEFFAAQKDDHVTDGPTISTDADDAAPTFKKPRKPRAKKVHGEVSAVKKTPKPKKVKVKFNEAAHLPPLYSPQHARAVEKQQGFLFGTSSQLALEEDVDYVRDLQMAILESEGFDAVPSSPRQVTTTVSVGHTERRLFWSASRDSWGHVIAANGVRRKGVVAAPRHAPAVQEPALELAIASEPAAQSHLDLAKEADERQDSLRSVNEVPEKLEESQVVDLCGTSPISAAPEEEPHAVGEPEVPLQFVGAASVVEATVPAPSDLDLHDSWMLLQSDDSDVDENADDTLTDNVAFLPIKNIPSPGPSVSQRLRTAISPNRSTTRPRPALTTLDSNIAMLAHTSPTKEQRAFLSQRSARTLKSPQNTLSREEGSRPALVLSPKRRGRPPKSASPVKHNSPDQPTYSASQPPVSSDFIAIDDISDSASEDLPLKDILAAKTALIPPKRRGRSPQGSQQSRKTPQSKSSFLNLDDISDSDAGRRTPSPRRRKAGATSPIQTLELSPSAVQDPDLPPIADGKAAIKPSDPCWLSISKVLFPQISAVVQSTKPCGESGRLSWWEKILMYDPIVLEDLTAWLAGRGVGVCVRRKAIKEKKKGRKKKGEIAEEEVVQVEEFEVVKEELRGWMVQKWCEEKSICCLWREGLRGGVKVRY